MRRGARRVRRSSNHSPKSTNALDWRALGDEAVQLLANYIRVNPTNPPGNEMAAITFLVPILEREGFTVQVLDTAAPPIARIIGR